MAFDLRPNSGSLFANERRREGKDDPHAQGQLKLSRELIEQLYAGGGDEIVWMSVWTKEPKQAGKKRWQSVSVRLPQSEYEGAVSGKTVRSATRPTPAQHDLDDDIPF